MALEMRNVFSSNVSQIGYDPETQELYVTWKTGRTSVYSGVPEKLAFDVSNAPSVGSALNEFIKPSFAHRYQ